MTVAYDYTGDISELTATELTALASALNKSRYDWSVEGKVLTISGECEADDYSENANDVGEDIKDLLWHGYEVDMDGTVETVEYEPDWDTMPGGWDFRD